MLCYAMLCYAMLCYLYHTILYYTTQRYTGQHYPMLDYTTYYEGIPCITKVQLTLLRYTMACLTVLYYTTLYYTTLHYTILYYTTLYTPPLPGMRNARLALLTRARAFPAGVPCVCRCGCRVVRGTGRVLCGAGRWARWRLGGFRSGPVCDKRRCAARCSVCSAGSLCWVLCAVRVFCAVCSVRVFCGRRRISGCAGCGAVCVSGAHDRPLLTITRGLCCLCGPVCVMHAAE